MTEEKIEIAKLLDDTSFDRERSPKDEKSNLLVSLLRNQAFDAGSAILISKYPIREEDLEELMRAGRVEIVQNSPTSVYLTKIGKLVALGETSLREREKKSN